MDVSIKAKLLFSGFILAQFAGAGVWSAPQYDRPVTAKINKRFEQQYKNDCSVCHGERGDGKSRAQYGLDPPPRDFTTRAAQEELSRERMITSVTYGRPGTAMVGWGKRLSAAEIAGVVDYIRSTFMLPEGSAPVKQSTIAQAHPGQKIYKGHCDVCHGDKGNGETWTHTGLNPPPRDFTAPESRAELTRERMTASVTFGRPGTAMMPFQTRLTAKEIADVVDFIHVTFVKAGQDSETKVKNEPADVQGVDHPAYTDEPSANEAGQPQASPVMPAGMSLPLPRGLAGDAEKGRQLYSSNCFTCHGLQGDGRGPRSSFIKPPPRNFNASQSRQTLNRPALYEAISSGKPGTVMPAWGKVLSEQEIAHVAEYVYQVFIRQVSHEADTGLHPALPGTAAQKKKVTRN